MPAGRKGTRRSTRNQPTARELPGGALQTAFRIQGYSETREPSPPPTPTQPRSRRTQQGAPTEGASVLQDGPPEMGADLPARSLHRPSGRPTVTFAPAASGGGGSSTPDAADNVPDRRATQQDSQTHQESLLAPSPGEEFILPPSSPSELSEGSDNPVSSAARNAASSALPRTPHRSMTHPLQDPRTPSRPQPPRTPRSVLRSATRRRQGPIGNQKSRAATDIWTFFQKRDGRHHCIFCLKEKAIDPEVEVATFGGLTGTSGMRKHLGEFHPDEWIGACDHLKIRIKAKQSQRIVAAYRRRHGQMDLLQELTSEAPDDRPLFSDEAFVDAIIKFIVADDQSINVIECPELRAIFLLLREELKDSDIPHRTTVRNRLLQLWQEYIHDLSNQLKKVLGKISYTMDLWTDENLRPFMAITAHWIETQLQQTAYGPQHILRLRSALVGFHPVPGHHTGLHLSEVFLKVLDRLAVTSKIGWITLDNASNNDTFMECLEEELIHRGIEFDKVTRRIRCFPHIVNLACKAVLGMITNMSYAAEGAEEFIASEGIRDPVASVRSLIRTIRASSIRRQYFADVQRALEEKDLQLLRDVDIRWSSTLLMIERAILLREAINRFMSHREFEELRKYQLTNVEWGLLEVYRKVLAVPHAFQQLLSAEKTPTLCNAIPSFEAMMQLWDEQKTEMPEVTQVIDAGMEKLDGYRNRTDAVPAYILAMIINPAQKLSFYSNYQPHKVQWAKDIFLRELEKYDTPQPASDEPTAVPAANPSMTWANELLRLSAPSRQRRPLIAEVNAYLLDSQTSTGSVEFWQENQLRYPTIFKLALDILPIQGSAVPCERVFSSAKETMTDRRSRISKELMEALQMLKFSIRHGADLDFTEGTAKEAEIKELEARILMEEFLRDGC